MKRIDKQTYFKNLAKFETTAIFFTDKVNLVKNEIQSNCIAIGLTFDLAGQISSDEIIIFLTKLKANRKKQLINCELQIDLIYYSWFDEMAGQFRFNFINSNHNKLPFGCELKFVETEKEIINKFIQSYYLEGIPFNELTNKEISQEYFDETNESFKLAVFCQAITRNE